MSKFSAYKLNRSNLNKRLTVFFLLFSAHLASLAQPKEAQDTTIQSCHYPDRFKDSPARKKFSWQCVAEIADSQALIIS
jgi:hypothetical protein